MEAKVELELARMPEDAFLTSELEAVDQADCLVSILSRSKDMLVMLSAYLLDGEENIRVSNEVLEGMVSQLECNMVMAGKLVDSWNERERAERKAR